MKLNLPPVDENTVALIAVGAAIVIAEFVSIPAVSHDVVIAGLGGLLGFIAKSRPTQPASDTAPPAAGQ